MFRPLSGFRAEYHYLRLIVVTEFDEWRVLVVGPETTIHGQRQFSQSKAQEHALTIAQKYVHEEKKDDLPILDRVEWEPSRPHDWLKFQG